MSEQSCVHERDCRRRGREGGKVGRREKGKEGRKREQCTLHQGQLALNKALGAFKSVALPTPTGTVSSGPRTKFIHIACPSEYLLLICQRLQQCSSE